MLRTIKLENFQAHTSFAIKLGEGVTTLVGPSDVGKTAVIRALKWLCLNVPSGDGFQRLGETSVAVSLSVDKQKVTRSRGKSKNLYTLNGKEYHAFGASVPDEIASLLNVSEINFQDQITLPFWFSVSAGQVGRELNAIVNLSVIDEVVSKVATETRKARSSVELTQARLDKYRAERDALAHVPEMYTELQQIQCTKEQLGAKRSKIVSARRTLKSCSEAQKRIDRVSRAKADGEKAMATGELMAQMRQQTHSLHVLIETLIRSQRGAKRVPSSESADRACRAVNDLRTETTRLRTLLADCKRARSETCERERRSGTLQEQLASLTKEGCPVCGGPLR